MFLKYKIICNWNCLFFNQRSTCNFFFFFLKFWKCFLFTNLIRVVQWKTFFISNYVYKWISVLVSLVFLDIFFNNETGCKSVISIKSVLCYELYPVFYILWFHSSDWQDAYNQKSKFCFYLHQNLIQLLNIRSDKWWFFLSFKHRFKCSLESLNLYNKIIKEWSFLSNNVFNAKCGTVCIHRT